MSNADGASERSAATRTTERWAAGSKLLFLVTEDWYFCSHRLPIARAARDAGAEVIVATRVRAHGPEIERERFRLMPLPWRRRSTNPWREFWALVAIVRLYRRERPDIVHHVALKPAVYGGVAARIVHGPIQINAIAGLGFTEVSRSLRARVLRRAMRTVLRAAWWGPRAHAIVQNREDADVLSDAGLLDRANVHLIRGSGVDVERFRAVAEPGGRIVAVYAGRFIWSKGIGELVEAARILQARGIDIDVRLVGEPDLENPEAIPARVLRAWEKQGLVTCRPWTRDITAVWGEAHIAVLPSYREGLPKALLEASACGRPIVASDVPGCRECVVPEENGLLVPARDARSLADAMARLAADAELRRRMGQNGRARVERYFSERQVVQETLDLYRRLCEERAS